MGYEFLKFLQIVNLNHVLNMVKQKVANQICTLSDGGKITQSNPLGPRQFLGYIWSIN